MTEEFAQVWQANRAYLVDLAFRMLGDVGAAEDVVQEAFTRLAATAADEIADSRAWLTVVTSRLCLDQLRSAHARREQAQDVSLPEAAAPVPQPPVPVDPADRITMDDEVRLALSVVLQRLSAAERVAFVLHDVFGTPFADIAETLGKPIGTCRQLARRARQKIADTNVRGGAVDAAEHRLITEKFIAACATGDLDGLLAVLHPRVWGVAELPYPIGEQTQHGAASVAATLMRFYGRGQTLVSHPIAGQPTLLAFAGRELFALITLTVQDDLITKIHVTADPAHYR